jgi:hypothetical protein
MLSSHTTVTLFFALLPSFVFAAPLEDFKFMSPSFNGIGYSSHVLTIENLEATRREKVKAEIQAALDKAKAESNNTNLSKFLNNLESRIYAQISQNLATAMFANGGTNQGTLVFEGNTISWIKDGTNIILTTIDTNGTRTVLTIPLGSFQF